MNLFTINMVTDLRTLDKRVITPAEIQILNRLKIIYETQQAGILEGIDNYQSAIKTLETKLENLRPTLRAVITDLSPDIHLSVHKEGWPDYGCGLKTLVYFGDTLQGGASGGDAVWYCLFCLKTL